MLRLGTMSRVSLSTSQAMLIPHMQLDLLEVMVVLMTLSSRSFLGTLTIRLEEYTLTYMQRFRVLELHIHHARRLHRCA